MFRASKTSQDSSSKLRSHCLNRHSEFRRNVNRKALTLLELLVVLVILAIVATVAVNSLQPGVDSARFDQTRKLMDNVQTAIIGNRDARQTDGTPMISGFLSDIGRLPRTPGINNNELAAGMELSELWQPNSSLATSFPFQFRSGPKAPVDYSSIQLPCGWRGPYLQLPLGTSKITDSWGRPFEFEFSDDASIDCIVWKPVGDFDQELKCGLKTGKVIVTGTLNFGQSEPSSVEVVLLGPNPDSSLSELAVFADEDSNRSTFVFSDVSIGLRAIHIRYDDKELTRYVQVAHQGLTLAINIESQQ